MKYNCLFPNEVSAVVVVTVW